MRGVVKDLPGPRETHWGGATTASPKCYEHRGQMDTEGIQFAVPYRRV